MFHIVDPDWDDRWKIPYDPAKANEYLDQAGYPRDEDGKRFDMPIYGFTSRIEFTEIADAAAGFINQLRYRDERDQDRLLDHPAKLGGEKQHDAIDSVVQVRPLETVRLGNR